VSDELENLDVTFLRDIADIIKNRTLFFLPFFGAFIAFLFSKSDYIKESNTAISAICIVLFFVCIKYIHCASNLLWVLEGLRFSFAQRKRGGEHWPDWEKDKTALVGVMKLLPQMVNQEHNWFKRTMLLMYLAAFCVLVDLFVGKWLSEQVMNIASHWMK